MCVRARVCMRLWTNEREGGWGDDEFVRDIITIIHTNRSTDAVDILRGEEAAAEWLCDVARTGSQ